MQHACRSLIDSSSIGRSSGGGTSSSSVSTAVARFTLSLASDAITQQPVVAQPHVVENRARRCDEDLLQNDADAELPRGARRADAAHRRTGDLELAAIGDMDAGQQLDQRGLARPVLTDDRVDLATANIQRAIAQRPRRPERLGDRPHTQKHLRVAALRCFHRVMRYDGQPTGFLLGLLNSESTTLFGRYVDGGFSTVPGSVGLVPAL